MVTTAVAGCVDRDVVTARVLSTHSAQRKRPQHHVAHDNDVGNRNDDAIAARRGVMSARGLAQRWETVRQCAVK